LEGTINNSQIAEDKKTELKTKLKEIKES